MIFIGLVEGLFLLIPLAIMAVGAYAVIQYVGRQSRSETSVAPDETKRLEEQVEQLQAEIDRLRERQDFVEKLRTPPSSGA